MAFDTTTVNPLIDYAQIANDFLVELIRSNKKEKLFAGIAHLRDELTKIEHFKDIPTKYLIHAIDNFTYVDFFPDDAEKIDYSEKLEVELLKILEDEELHSRADLIELLGQKLDTDDDLTSDFNIVVKKLTGENKIMKCDVSGNAIKGSGRGTGRYTSLKKITNFDLHFLGDAPK